MYCKAKREVAEAKQRVYDKLNEIWTLRKSREDKVYSFSEIYTPSVDQSAAH